MISPVTIAYFYGACAVDKGGDIWSGPASIESASAAAIMILIAIFVVWLGHKRVQAIAEQQKIAVLSC